MSDIKKDISKLTRSGFFPIVISSILEKACALIGSIILVHMLSKDDYGFYTRVINDFYMLFILNDLGCGVAMMQFCGENYSDKRLREAFFAEPLRFEIFFSILTGAVIFISPLFYPYRDASDAMLTRALFGIPFLTGINSFVVLYLRMLTRNRKYAIINILQSFFTYLFLIGGALKWGTSGAVLSRYAVAVVILAISVIIAKDELKINWHAKVLNRSQKLSFIKYAVGAQFNNSIGVLLNRFDVFLIGLIVADDSVLAGYKVAATIPQALVFVPTSILIFALPYFTRNMLDREWVRKSVRKLFLCCIGVNGLIMVVGIAFSGIIVPLIFGQKYDSSVPLFIILMISFFFTGSFQIPAANIIFTQHRVSMNIVITVISNIANCILDYVLIRRSGAMGAAVATCAVSVITAVVSIGFLKYVLSFNIYYKTETGE